MSALLEKPSTVHGVICVFLLIFEISDHKSRDLFSIKPLYCPIAQSLSALDFNFEQAVEGSILTVGKNVESENLNVIIRAIN